MRKIIASLAAGGPLLAAGAPAPAQDDPGGEVSDDLIAEQRMTLAEMTTGLGYGPQSPRDIDSAGGSNPRIFSPAPGHREMNLCNIHFHDGAEHRGGEFTTSNGNGDGHGHGPGFRFDGALSEAERAPWPREVGETGTGALHPGDTVELHYVYTTADADPGPELETCIGGPILNPQLRIEAQVLVLVNDAEARDFGALTRLAVLDGFHQAPGLPGDTGTPVRYAGSTTGAEYNESASPYQVSWGVRPRVLKVSIASVEDWLADNLFGEEAARDARNLVINPDLLSAMAPVAE